MRLRDGTEVADPRLGRCISFDDRSRGFPVRAALGRYEQTERSYRWYLPSTARVLNQGSQGSCVGMSITNELRYTPRPNVALDESFAVERIYWEAQRLDDWDGGSYAGADPVYEGTSVLAGVKAAQAAGFYGAYRWAFSEPELALAVGYLGPVVLGLTWREKMFDPDALGFIRPEGEVAGGHAILCVGVNVRNGFYVLANSWSAGWGDRGRCYVSRADMASLLADDGEAVVVVERKRPKRVAS